MNKVHMIYILLIAIGLLGLLIGTITDFQKREVADWVNFSMVAAGLGLRIMYSVAEKDIWFVAIPLAWIAIVWIFGIGMYYTGQWGGGDVKMLAGIAAIFGTYSFAHAMLPDPLGLAHNSMFIGHLLLNIAVVGAAYGLIWSAALAAKKRNTFKKAFSTFFSQQKRMFYLAAVAGVILTVIPLTLEPTLFLMGVSLGVLILILPLVYGFGKSIEECMIRFMKTSELTEGEWIVDEIMHKGEYITGPKELGITNKQIELFKKYKIKGARVKIGIPFVPAFFIATIVTMIFGNLLLYLL